MVEITFKESCDFPRRLDIAQITRDEVLALLRFHPFEKIEIVYDSFHVENPYLKVSAAADEPGRIYIKINTFEIDWDDMLSKTLPHTLAHEFHHAARWLYVHEFHLGEMCVLEGLAEHFVIELKNSPVPQYIRPVADELLETLKPAIRRDLFDTGFNHRMWQRGDVEQQIPQAFAYSLGFQLVGEYLARTGRKASECFDLDCRKPLAALNLN